MTKTKPMGFAAFDTETDCDAGFELELRDKFGAPSGLFISVVGKHGKVFRDHVSRSANKHLAKQFASQRKGKEQDAPTVESSIAEAAELLAACTTGWRADPDKFGPVEPFTHDAARALYLKSQLVREQVDEAVGDLTNFIKG